MAGLSLGSRRIGLRRPGPRRAGSRKPGTRGSAEAVEAAVEERAGAKNKATPKRSEALKARPVTPYLQGSGRSGGSRREVARGDKDRRRRSLDAQRLAMKGAGDLSKLPPRDARPEAAFARSYVDRRRNLVTLILLAYVLLFINFLVKGKFVVLTLLLAIVFLAIVDAFVLGFTVKRMVRKEFPGTKEKVSLYAVQRATLPRRFRLPRPGVGVPAGR